MRSRGVLALDVKFQPTAFCPLGTDLKIRVDFIDSMNSVQLTIISIRNMSFAASQKVGESAVFNLKRINKMDWVNKLTRCRSG